MHRHARSQHHATPVARRKRCEHARYTPWGRGRSWPAGVRWRAMTWPPSPTTARQSQALATQSRDRRETTTDRRADPRACLPPAWTALATQSRDRRETTTDRRAHPRACLLPSSSSPLLLCPEETLSTFASSVYQDESWDRRLGPSKTKQTKVARPAVPAGATTEPSLPLQP